MTTKSSSLLRHAVPSALLALAAVSGRAATLTVVTTSDQVNGNVASPAALAADPGPDGISLREALAAANRVAGPHRIEFLPALAGRTIALRDTLPRLQRDDFTIEGLADGAGHPALTLDGAGILAPTPETQPGILRVQASRVAIRHLRFVNTPLFLLGVVTVEAGALDTGRVPLVVDQVLIEGNVLDNSGVTYPPTFAVKGIDVRTDPADPAASGATVTNVTIRDNVFLGFRGDNDAVIAGIGGRNSRLENLTVTGNEFRDCTYGVEVGGHTGPGNLVRGIRVEGNRFENILGAAVPTGIGSAGNRYENLVVAGNVVIDSPSGVIVSTLGGPDTTLEGVEIRDNVFERVNLIVVLQGAGARTRLREVTIERNVASGPGGSVVATTAGGEESVIERVEIVDNVLSAVAPIGPSGRATVIQDVLFARNVNRNPDFFLSLCGGLDGRDSVLRRVVVASNAATGGVDVHGGCGIATNNLIDDLRILNNTVVTAQVFFPAVRVQANPEGASGNQIRGLEAANGIFQTPGPNFEGEIQPGQVHHSLVSDPAFLEGQGNIAGDPRFVNAAAGDFHLLAGSPAIDAGTSDGAPRLDADGRGRVDDATRPNSGAGELPFFDLGAYEFVPAAGGAPCSTTAHSLCLNASRFRVEAEWETPQSQAGAAQAVPLTPDTGYLWFFSPQNVEAVVKVLDACPLNQRYWTFAGGLTDVETLLTVTDTRSGAARQYANPQGTPFQPIQDTGAFATCP